MIDDQSNLFRTEQEKKMRDRNRQKANLTYENGKDLQEPERTPPPTEFEYEFVLTNANAQKVQVAGEFNGWKPNEELTKEGTDKWAFKTVLPIHTGKDKYEYKFVVNGSEWVVNPDLPQTKTKEGFTNNFVHIPN